MKNLFKVIIGGPATSGKTTLLHLLEGDQNIINYNHDKVLKLYKKIFNERSLYFLKDLIKNKKSVVIKSRTSKKKKYLNLETLKKALYEIGYARIVASSFYNYAKCHYSSASFFY